MIINASTIPILKSLEVLVPVFQVSGKYVGGEYQKNTEPDEKRLIVLPISGEEIKNGEPGFYTYEDKLVIELGSRTLNEKDRFRFEKKLSRSSNTQIIFRSQTLQNIQPRKFMSLKIQDENNIPFLLSSLEELEGISARVGVAAEPNSELAIYAGAQEFGAVITSKKAIAKLYYMLVEEGLIDKEELPIYIWMKAKTEIIIPERSFLRSIFESKEAIDKAMKLFLFAMDRALAGQGKMISALEAAADSFVASIKSTIASGVNPANHPLTTARKGHSKTLMGKEPRLQKSITREIIKGG